MLLVNEMKRLKNTSRQFLTKALSSMRVSLLVGLGVLSLAAAPISVGAINVYPVCDANPAANTSSVCEARGTDQLFGPNSIWTRILNTLIFVIGAVAVLLIIIGGLRYVLSAGDQASITGAKNTILYAVVGLAVAILSGAIVNFVLSRL